MKPQLIKGVKKKTYQNQRKLHVFQIFLLFSKRALILYWTICFIFLSIGDGGDLQVDLHVISTQIMRLLHSFFSLMTDDGSRDGSLLQEMKEENNLCDG